MLESAKNWALSTRFVYRDETFAEKVYSKIVIQEFDNKDFHIQLNSAAEDSSQGGKLSFWNCVISKDDKKWLVGISSDLLLTVLLQNDFSKGCCNSKFSFARINGKLGLLSDSMEEYKDASRDMVERNHKSKKTKNWIVGRNYKTLTKDEVFIGEYYRWWRYRYDYCTQTIELILKDIPEKVFLTVDTESSFINISQYCSKSRCYINVLDSKPAREEGNVSVKIDIDKEEWLEKCKQMLDKGYWNYKYLLLSSNCFEVPKLESVIKYLNDYKKVSIYDSKGNLLKNIMNNEAQRF